MKKKKKWFCSQTRNPIKKLEINIVWSSSMSNDIAIVFNNKANNVHLFENIHIYQNTSTFISGKYTDNRRHPDNKE